MCGSEKGEVWMKGKVVVRLGLERGDRGLGKGELDTLEEGKER